MRAHTFICNGCGERIESEDCPVVVTISAGVPQHRMGADGTFDITDHPLPAIVRELVAHPTEKSHDYCGRCLAEKLGLPLFTGPADQPVAWSPTAPSPAPASSE